MNVLSRDTGGCGGPVPGAPLPPAPAEAEMGTAVGSYMLGGRWSAAMAIAADDSLDICEKRRQLERIADQAVVTGACGHPWLALVPKGSGPPNDALSDFGCRRGRSGGRLQDHADAGAARFPCPDCIDAELEGYCPSTSYADSTASTSEPATPATAQTTAAGPKKPRRTEPSQHTGPGSGPHGSRSTEEPGPSNSPAAPAKPRQST